MPLVALGASKLTGDPTRFKASYTANHPLLPPPIVPPLFLSPPQVCYVNIEDRYVYTEYCYVYTEDCYVYAEDCYVYTEECYVYPSSPPPVAPPLSLASSGLLCLHRGSLCLHRGSSCLHTRFGEGGGQLDR